MNTTSSLSEGTLPQKLKKINLVSGKGGVGRTTMALALARGAALEGKKTLLLEMEDESGWSSSLARPFGKKSFSCEPELLEKNLYGMKLSAHVGQEKFLTMFLKFETLAKKILANQGIRWFLEGAPAFREMGYFYQFLLAMKMDYEVLVLDLPATGHLLGLVRLPKLLLKMMPMGPIAEKLKEGQSYIYNPKLTSAWVVTLPQALPVSEALELEEALLQEQIPVGGYILNRVPLNPFTEEEEKTLRRLSGKSHTARLMVDLERIRRYREAVARLASSASQQDIWLAPEFLDPNQDLQFVQHIKPYSTQHHA